MLMLEVVGNNVDDIYPNETVILLNIKAGMVAALKQIHSAGFLHGDIT